MCKKMLMLKGVTNTITFRILEFSRMGFASVDHSLLQSVRKFVVSL
jgi:hypothetical protein